MNDTLIKLTGMYENVSQKTGKRRYTQRPRHPTKATVTPRTCLRCRRSFPSSGIGNRICQRCTDGIARDDHPYQP